MLNLLEWIGSDEDACLLHRMLPSFTCFMMLFLKQGCEFFRITFKVLYHL